MKKFIPKPTVSLKKEVFEVPGPGSYNNNLKESSTGASFGKAIRDRAEKNFEGLPGPGDYQ